MRSSARKTPAAALFFRGGREAAGDSLSVSGHRLSPWLFLRFSGAKQLRKPLGRFRRKACRAGGPLSFGNAKHCGEKARRGGFFLRRDNNFCRSHLRQAEKLGGQRFPMEGIVFASDYKGVGAQLRQVVGELDRIPVAYDGVML